MAFINPIAFGQ